MPRLQQVRAAPEETALAAAKLGLARSRAARDRAREEEVALALVEFERNPDVAPKAKVRSKRCCFSWRRYYGCCYSKTLHEAVLDGDARAIAKRLQRLQRGDRRRGVERFPVGGKAAGRAGKLANEFDEQGRTALSLAIKAEREDLADLLLTLSADPDVADDVSQHAGKLTGASPTLHAVLGDLPGTVLKLAKRKADLNLKNAFGMTPVMLACLAGDVDVVELLLEHGADPELRDAAGWTPLMYCAYGGHLKCAQVVVRYGVSLKTKDKNGYRAVDWAQYVRRKYKSKPHGNVECYLEEYKPSLNVGR
mmetsp:Transcript_13619/g.45390  ORF Transcript_13619/g.45390 Transcript_13619/m.45390 type:complete len:308 (-) Transcript_13619:545-1468(-)